MGWSKLVLHNTRYTGCMALKLYLHHRFQIHRYFHHCSQTFQIPCQSQLGQVFSEIQLHPCYFQIHRRCHFQIRRCRRHAQLVCQVFSEFQISLRQIAYLHAVTTSGFGVSIKLYNCANVIKIRALMM